MTDAPERLVLRTVGDLVEVVPSLLGFHPEESVVVIALRGGSIALTARADLWVEPEELVASFAPVVRRFPDCDLVLLAFTASEDGWEVLEDLAWGVGCSGGRLLVRADGRYWYDGPGSLGVPYDADANVHVVRAAVEGRAVRRSRAELAALVAPPADPEPARVRLAELGAALDPPAVVARAEAILGAHDGRPGPLDEEDVAVLVLASEHASFLDAALLSCDEGVAGPRCDLWLQVVRGTPAERSGPALLGLALAAWLTGDGSLQVVCLQAALDRPAPAAWFDVLDLVNRDAVPPDEWPGMRVALGEVLGVVGPGSRP